MKVAIIIPTYNRPKYLALCLSSLEKTFIEKDTLIYIIDDCSDDNDTIDIINNFKKNDCIIKINFKKQNNGIAKSLLIGYDYCFMNGYEFVIVVDSDVIVNNYFYDMMTYYKILFPNNIISGFNTLTLSSSGKPRHPIVYDGKFYMTKMTSGAPCIGIDENIYNKYVKYTLSILENSRGDCFDTKSTKKSSDDGNLVICTVPSVSEHIGMKSSLDHFDNPDISIDFREYIELDNEKNENKIITVNIATYPKREESFKKVIDKLLSIDIIDKIRVYLNEYVDVPEYLINDKIEYVIGLLNLRDSGKFYWANSYKDEYYFTLDDDLLINEDYIKKHIELLKKYNNKIFVSLHGKILKDVPEHFRDLKKSFHFRENVNYDEYINFIGTGVMVFDNSKYKIFSELFKYHGMCDLWISLYCQLNHISCLVRKHSVNEIELIYDGGDTLWNEQEKLKEQHKEILQNLTNWVIYKNIEYNGNNTI